jgi:ligand-binding sensor domain-containing protein/signal transduction histidine kinase
MPHISWRNLHKITLALLIISSTASSQHTAFPSLENHMITVEHIPSPNFARTNAILRDNRGFLWFGTTRGLCKYDGYQVRVFPNGFPPDGPHQVITSIIKIGNDSLLVGTLAGLSFFDLKTEQFSPFIADTILSKEKISAIVQERRGTIWTGTYSYGLFSYDRSTGAVKRFTTDNGLSDNEIMCLLSDHSEKIWIGTVRGGLNALIPATSSVLRYGKALDGLVSDHVTALFERDDHEMWIGTDEGLNVLDMVTGEIRTLDLHSNIKHTISSIVSDPSGRVWIAATDLGLLSYFNGVLTRFTTLRDRAGGISESDLMALYRDPVVSDASSSFLWVATRYGVDKIVIAKNPFTNHIRGQDSLDLDRGAVLSLCEDRKGILWVGLWGGGLEALRPTRGGYRRIAHFRNLPTDPSSLPSNDIGTVFEDHSGTLWIGTFKGLAALDAQRKHLNACKRIGRDSSSLPDDLVNAIYEDHSGTLWISTNGGLSRLLRDGDSYRFKNYLHDPADAHPINGNAVSDILEDRRSQLWVATHGRGLNRLNPDGTFTRYIYEGDSLRNRENLIHNFVEDRDGLFWMSTRGGLVSFDPASGKFIPHAIEQLHEAPIFGIAPDQRGDLWLSTAIGLAKFSPKTGTLVRYDESQGLLFKELHSAFFRNARGKLLVGGLNGFTEFDPDSVSIISHPPEIALTGFSVFDKELPTSILSRGAIQLSYDQNFFSFSFAALDYANPSQNRFSYRMEGVDREWIDAGTRNYARYTHLDPGNYIFRVKGSNSENVWNEIGTSIAITIAPPFWQTWWFRLLALAFIIAAVYAVYRYRLQKALEIERVRLRIAHDLHDDVGSNLSAIAMASRSMQRTPRLTREIKHKLAEIYETAVITQEGMKDLVWFIKPEHDTLDELFVRMRETATSLLGGIEVGFESPKTGDSQRVPIDFKRSVFLAFKEILTNIARHASASKVEITITLRDSLFEMVIHDDGKGFDNGGNHRGTGLQSIQKRAQSVGGSCEFISRPEAGTTVRFRGRL